MFRPRTAAEVKGVPGAARTPGRPDGPCGSNQLVTVDRGVDHRLPAARRRRCCAIKKLAAVSWGAEVQGNGKPG
jgi:hypothetical protein